MSSHFSLVNNSNVCFTLAPRVGNTTLFSKGEKAAVSALTVLRAGSMAFVSFSDVLGMCFLIFLW